MAKKKSEAADSVKTRVRRVKTQHAPAKTLKKAAPKRAVKSADVEPYDAERSFGMIPGLAERMAEYMRTMRDDR